jgi:hypothetical protein
VNGEKFFSQFPLPPAYQVPSGTKLDQNQKPVDVWLPVFSARGWTMKGTNNRWH